VDFFFSKVTSDANDCAIESVYIGGFFLSTFFASVCSLIEFIQARRHELELDHDFLAVAVPRWKTMLCLIVLVRLILCVIFLLWYMVGIVWIVNVLTSKVSIDSGTQCAWSFGVTWSFIIHTVVFVTCACLGCCWCFASHRYRRQLARFRADERAVLDLPTNLSPPVTRENAKLAPGEQCSICLDVYDDTTLLQQLPCQHIFHKECVDMWLQRSRLCPMCKRSILEDPAMFAPFASVHDHTTINFNAFMSSNSISNLTSLSGNHNNNANANDTRIEIRNVPRRRVASAAGVNAAMQRYDSESTESVSESSSDRSTQSSDGSELDSALSDDDNNDNESRV